MVCYLPSCTALSGSEVDEGRFVTDHLSHNRKKCCVGEVNPMVDANISWIEYELEILIQIPMSNRQSIFVSNMVEENRIVLARWPAKPELAWSAYHLVLESRGRSQSEPFL
jgi:hypothetical protein